MGKGIYRMVFVQYIQSVVGLDFSRKMEVFKKENFQKNNVFDKSVMCLNVENKLIVILQC